MKGKRILVVDDEPNIRRILQVALEKSGAIPLLAGDVPEAIAIVDRERPDCVISDVTMPGQTGYDLLKAVKSTHPEMPVIIMTAFGTIPQAVQAIREGAYEYVTKPFDLDHLKKIVNASMSADSPALGGKKGSSAATTFLAESPAMLEVLETVRQVADARATVLIWGESGVGKEVVARALHTMSSRSKRNFVAVSCAALPETLLESELFGYEKGAFTGAQGAKAGRFEMAHEGTLFLDEIGEIPMTTQVKLLRVLQEREFDKLGGSRPIQVDVRLVTATNRDLREAVDQGLFRLDLLYRLQVVELHIPALRERKEDILPLARYFLEKYGKDNRREPLEIGADAESLLLCYAWPGNVRELENSMERATVLAPNSEGSLTAKLLPPPMRQAA